MVSGARRKRRALVEGGLKPGWAEEAVLGTRWQLSYNVFVRVVFDSGVRYAMRLLIMYEYVVYNSFQERGGVFSKFKTKIGN